MLYVVDGVPDLAAIKKRVESLKPGTSAVYWCGRTGFMHGALCEREWEKWVEEVNECGWFDFTQRKVGHRGEHGIFEYIARHRITKRRPMRW